MTTLVGRDDEFGGGYVRLRLNSGGEVMLPGRELTREEILGMANWRSLVRTEHISLYPQARPDGLRRFVVGPNKAGSFKVIEGVVVGDELTKDQASEIAGRQ